MMTRRLLLFSLLVLLGAGYVHAQAPEQDCPNAIPVCRPFYQQTTSYVGVGADTELNASNQGCLFSGEKNDVWYIINITTPGVLQFTISPINASDDYDFGVWDITGVGCSAIYNYITRSANSYPPIGCNYSGVPGPTGLSNTNTGSQWSTGINVVAGQTFAINISNFSSTASGYSLDFSTATSSVYDTIPPTVTSVMTHCGFPSDTLTVKTSEPVKCNSISSNASEWTITPAGSSVPLPVLATGFNCGTSPNSATTTISLILSATIPPGNYNLNLATGIDNNTLLDNCGNEALAAAIPFTILSPDPQRMILVDTPACNMARVHLDKPVKCSTIAPDGSDFTITGPETVTLRRAAPGACTGQGLTDVIDLYFSKSIYTAGTYTIGLQTGSDGDVLEDTCGVIAAGTIDFILSDQGYVEGIASPAVLCAPGYLNLASQAYIAPPAQTISCGITTGACTTPLGDFTAGNSAATGTTVGTPLNGQYNNARTQLLFHAYELRAAGLRSGTISRIAFNVTSVASTGYDGFTVKMGCTGTTALTDFERGTVPVYGPANFTPVAGANAITLDYPYNWDGESNIVVELCYSNTSSTGDDAMQSTTGLLPGSVIRAHDFSLSGCGLTSASSAVTPFDTRPNITFTSCRPPTPAQSFLWRPGAFLLDSTRQNTSAFAPKTTVYQVQIVDSNYCYRRDTAGVIVSVRNPSIDHDTSICLNDRIQINAFGGSTYTFYPATGLSCTDCASPFASPVVSTTYFVSIADQYGCADTLDINVKVNPLPVVRIFPHDTTVVYGVPLQMFARTQSGVRQYYWSPASGLNSSIIANPIATPKVTTDYVVIVTDTNLCRGSDTSLVLVRTDAPVSIPTGFTPNGDGRNDYFGVFNLSYQRVVEFRVFNRWGTEVFSSQDGGDRWDGTYKNEPQPAGVYQYLIRITWPDGRAQRYQGDVTLIR